MEKNQAKLDSPFTAKPSSSNSRNPNSYGRRNRPTLRLVILSLMVCALAMTGAGWMIYPQAVGSYHWRQAQRAIEDYEFPAARRHLQECLKVWPENGETQFLMARTCRRGAVTRDDFDQARQYLKEAKRLNWIPKQIHLESLLLMAQVGMVRQVEAALRQHLLAGQGEERLVFEALVIGCWQDNLLNEAHEWVTDWINNFPEDWHARYWKGRILEAGLRHELAAAEYQQVLQIKPDHAETHLRCGQVLLKRKRFPDALPHFQAFLRTEPRNPAALLGLARCQHSLELPAVAKETLDQLLADQPEFAPALVLRGRLELDSDNPQEALGWLLRAEKLAPFDLQVNQNLADAYRLLNKNQEAEAYARKKEKIEHDLQRMEELTKEIIAHPRNVALRYEAGSILVGLGDLQEGIRWLVSALLIDPNHQPSNILLAQCLKKLGDRSLAEVAGRILENAKPD